MALVCSLLSVLIPIRVLPALVVVVDGTEPHAAGVVVEKASPDPKEATVTDAKAESIKDASLEAKEASGPRTSVAEAKEEGALKQQDGGSDERQDHESSAVQRPDEQDVESGLLEKGSFTDQENDDYQYGADELPCEENMQFTWDTIPEIQSKLNGQALLSDLSCPYSDIAKTGLGFGTSNSFLTANVPWNGKIVQETLMVCVGNSSISLPTFYSWCAGCLREFIARLRSQEGSRLYGGCYMENDGNGGYSCAFGRYTGSDVDKFKLEKKVEETVEKSKKKD